MMFQETELAIGTGFCLKSGAYSFLFTCLHNITGVNSITGENLHSKGGRPDSIIARFHSKAGGWHPIKIPLIIEDEHTSWIVHPNHATKIDAAALPIMIDGFKNIISEQCQLHYADELERDEFILEPGQDCFVVGYPMNIASGGRIPIWKRASIASEPDFDYNSLPCILIDTATRKGMSGSPVYAQISGFWAPSGVTDLGQHRIGIGRQFMGLYSGRIGAGDQDAQLGYVWKYSALKEMIRPVSGSTTPLKQLLP